MNRAFLTFVVRAVLAEGECYRVEKVGDYLDSRELVPPGAISIKAAVVERFQSISEGDDYLLISVRLIDQDGAVYLAHLNTQWDKLFSQWAATTVISGDELG